MKSHGLGMRLNKAEVLSRSSASCILLCSSYLRYYHMPTVRRTSELSFGRIDSPFSKKSGCDFFHFGIHLIVRAVVSDVLL